MTLAIVTGVTVALAFAVAVYAVLLLQRVTTRALELVADESTQSRLERDGLLDRLQAPFAASQRLTPYDQTPDDGDDDDTVDKEWAGMEGSEVFVPDDLQYLDDDGTVTS